MTLDECAKRIRTIHTTIATMLRRSRSLLGHAGLMTETETDYAAPGAFKVMPGP